MTKKPFRLSASSIKTFCGSPTKWGGSYLLWLKDPTGDAMYLGKIFEHWLFTGEDNWSLADGVTDKVKFIEKYDWLKANAKLDFKKGQHNVEIKWELFWVPCIWYVDNLIETVDDIKTTQYITKDDSAPNFWSGLSYWDEYRLQLWIYFRLTWIRHTRILEYWYHTYKDGRKNCQIIDFIWTDEEDKKMEEKYRPIVEEMKELYNKFEIWFVCNT